MQILAVIPARYNSQRFPGKPLVLIGDKPMVQWVYEAACSCQDFSDVIVATDDQRIVDCVQGFGGHVELTASTHETGTDRIAEVADRHGEMSVIVNVQGDQPFVTPMMLSQLLEPYLQAERPPMTTLACPLTTPEAFADPNTVKVLCDRKGNALYFSRSAVPYFRNSAPSVPVYHHLGLYAFDRQFLLEYAQLAATPLEQCEALEQLRALEHGFPIRVCLTKQAVPEINTPEDLEKINPGSMEINI